MKQYTSGGDVNTLICKELAYLERVQVVSVKTTNEGQQTQKMLHKHIRPHV